MDDKPKPKDPPGTVQAGYGGCKAPEPPRPISAPAYGEVHTTGDRPQTRNALVLTTEDDENSRSDEDRMKSNLSDFLESMARFFRRFRRGPR